jgi:hypothetical protein
MVDRRTAQRHRAITLAAGVGCFRLEQPASSSTPIAARRFCTRHCVFVGAGLFNKEFDMAARLVLGLALIAALATSARAQSKDECEGKVMAAIKMLEIRTMMKRSEQKHGDLSIADIERIQKTQGSCAAAKEIDKRTQKGAELKLF